MIRSMTGFGRSETVTEGYKLIVEMKAVNHRYSEFSIKMPKKLNFFEAGIRTLLKEYINRGKVDIFITYEDYRESDVCIKYNPEIAKTYLNSTKEILSGGGSVGRKLDFIAQEMNREANTILSKANSLDISNTAIDLKTEIEKVREQIQNIE